MSIKVTVPKPCSENWQNMERREQSRYCSTCQKCVIDFTNFSDTELVAYFRATDNTVCGRFNRYQLDKLLIVKKINSNKKLNLFSTLMLVSTIGFSNNIKENLQRPLTLVQEKKNPKDNGEAKKAISCKEFGPVNIKGKVYDCETKEALQYAAVSVKGTKIGTLTDKAGNFDLLIPSEYNNADAVILVHYTGYLAKEYKLSSIKNENWEIGLSGIVLTGEVLITRKPTIWTKFVRLFKRKHKQPKCD